MLLDCILSSFKSSTKKHMDKDIRTGCCKMCLFKLCIFIVVPRFPVQKSKRSSPTNSIHKIGLLINILWIIELQKLLRALQICWMEYLKYFDNFVALQATWLNRDGNVGLLVHHFDPDWNISTFTRLIDTEFCATFMVPRGWIPVTSVIPWLFI